MKLFYTLGVNLYSLFVHIASVWNPKAKKWVQGRRDAWKKIEAFSAKNNVEKKSLKTYWFHCASLGEFEQGRPLIEGLKKQDDCKVIVSFFSPSGYEIRKNYELADLVIYLPTDSKKNALKFYKLIQPDCIFFIKYEFWANYIFEAKRLNIPLYSISAVFRKNQLFFKFYGGYMRRVLGAVTKIFVQDNASKQLLGEIKISSIVSGDTRYDRVMNNSKQAKKFDLIKTFCESEKVIVLGSVWPEDIAIIGPSIIKLAENWKVIIAPHEIDEAHLIQIESVFKATQIVRYSKYSLESKANILLIDNIGMLMHLYGYANVAYVGGAFKSGLHNILEPASFGLPVIFGPNHSKFPEAKLFIDNSVGFSIQDEVQFNTAVQEIINKDLKNIVIDFMQSQTGATDKILKEIM